MRLAGLARQQAAFPDLRSDWKRAVPWTPSCFFGRRRIELDRIRPPNETSGDDAEQADIDDLEGAMASAAQAACCHSIQRQGA